MSRNDPRSLSRSLPHDPRRSLTLWLSVALAVGTWSSRLAGQNAAPLAQSPDGVTDSSVTKGASQPTRKTTVPHLDRWRMARPSSAAAPTIGSTRSQKPASTASNSVKRDGSVQPASHEELSGTAPGNLGLSSDAPSSNFVPSPLPPMMSYARPAVPGPSIVFPSERTVPPQITGSHLGLQPGETATERSLRLMTVIADLEEQNALLKEQNAKLSADLKAKEAKLQSGTLQIGAARKELSQAQDEFQRLRKENADLREKFRSAEQESASLMRSLSPLLKQILQSDDDPPAKDEK